LVQQVALVLTLLLQAHLLAVILYFPLSLQQAEAVAESSATPANLVRLVDQQVEAVVLT
jgi:hypothetical protein